MDASNFADVDLETTDVPAAQVAALVRQTCRDWPGFGASVSEAGSGPACPAPGAGGDSHPGADAASGAGRAELTRRVMSRRVGGSWPEPGDPLRGQTPEYFTDVAARAAAEADALDRSEPGPVLTDTGLAKTVRIDTDGRSVAEAADLILAATPFPAR
jgi:hypothetical protein